MSACRRTAVFSFICLLPIVSGILVSEKNNQTLERSSKSADDRSGEKDVYEAQASYEYPHYYHDHGYGYHHHHVSHVNDDAVKGLLVPLAGIALLGAVAIAASNPLLLQIGVIGGSVGKKRKKRAIPRLDDLKVLEKFLEQITFPVAPVCTLSRADSSVNEVTLDVRGASGTLRKSSGGSHQDVLDCVTIQYRQIPKPQVAAEEKKLQANYLLCSGISDKSNRCFERVTCEVEKPGGNATMFEKQVLDIVISDIMRNEYLPQEVKHRIQQAQKIGFRRGECSKYYCKEIDPGYPFDP